MADTASRMLELLSLLQARATGLETSWPAASVGTDDPARYGAPASAGLSRAIAERPSRRLPRSRRRRDAAAGTRRRGSDRDSRRPHHCRSCLGGQRRGDRSAGPRQARADPALAPAPSRPRPRLDDSHAPGCGANGRSASPDRDRRGVPRCGVPALFLPPPRPQRDPQGGRAPLARESWPPLVPRSVGPSSLRLADLPRRSLDQADDDWPALQAPPAAEQRRRDLHRAEHRGRAESIRGRHHPSRGSGASGSPSPHSLGRDQADRRSHLGVQDWRR